MSSLTVVVLSCILLAHVSIGINPIQSSRQPCGLSVSDGYMQPQGAADMGSDVRDWRAYHEAHRAQRNAACRANYREHQVERLTYAQLRQLVCRAEISERNKRNRPAIAVRQRAYLAANQERIGKRLAAYRKAHPYSSIRDKVLARNHARPELRRAAEHRRRTRKAGNGGTYSVAEWSALCESWGNKCLCCGTTERLTIDHVVPLACGGRNDIENLQLLCRSCNCHKKTKTIDYRPGQAATRQGKLPL